MARRVYTLHMDVSPFREAMDEAVALYGDGTGVPARIGARLSSLCDRRGKDLAPLAEASPIRDGAFTLHPGHELLAVLVDLRACRPGWIDGKAPA